jgi:hypothetical protein
MREVIRDVARKVQKTASRTSRSTPASESKKGRHDATIRAASTHTIPTTCRRFDLDFGRAVAP